MDLPLKLRVQIQMIQAVTQSHRMMKMHLPNPNLLLRKRTVTKNPVTRIQKVTQTTGTKKTWMITPKQKPNPKPKLPAPLLPKNFLISKEHEF